MRDKETMTAYFFRDSGRRLFQFFSDPGEICVLFDQSFDADPIIKSKMFTITNMINSHSKPPI